VLSFDVITRCRAAERVADEARPRTRVCVRVLFFTRRYARESRRFNFHFPRSRFLLSDNRLIAPPPAHLPMVKRVTREAFTDFIAETSVFTFGYNYALMCGESRRKRVFA